MHIKSALLMNTLTAQKLRKIKEDVVFFFQKNLLLHHVLLLVTKVTLHFVIHVCISSSFSFSLGTG